MKNEIKKRTIALEVSDLKVREAEGESRTIEGYALKFGVRSRMLCDFWESYYEVLERGCMTMGMLKRQDIKLTLFHDRQLVLARSKKGRGTLEYGIDEVGVWFRAEMPKTADGDKALELVARGDIGGCSFIYSTKEDDREAVTYERIKESDEDVLLRHVLRIDNVYDFTLTTDPAYEQTTVTRREVEAYSDTILREDTDEKPEDGEEEKEDKDEQADGDEPKDEEPEEKEPEAEEQEEEAKKPVDRSKAREQIAELRRLAKPFNWY